MNRHWVSLVALLLIPTFTFACPFCPTGQTTLLGETNQAHLIVFGTLSNAKQDPTELNKGTTDLNIEVVVKDHEFLKGKKVLTIPRFIPPDPKSKTKHLIFCEIYKGQLDPYRGEAVPEDSKIAQYLKGAIELKEKPAAEQLAFFFKHFDSTDWSISADAFQEFGNSDYKDVRVAASKMDPDRIFQMLKDPNTSIARYGLLGLLLGHCGKTETHGKALKEFIDDPKVRQATGLDGLLTGLLLLDPKGGLEYVGNILKDTKEEFLVRYAALRALRFFWEYRNDILEKKAIIATIQPLVDQSDIADLAIEDLRKWEQWDLASKLIPLFEKPSHNIPIVQRSIIKFALNAPAGNTETAAFLKKLRGDEKQAERVKDLEQLLELEKSSPAAPAKKS